MWLVSGFQAQAPHTLAIFWAIYPGSDGKAFCYEYGFSLVRCTPLFLCFSSPKHFYLVRELAELESQRGNQFVRAVFFTPLLPISFICHFHNFNRTFRFFPLPHCL